MTHLLKASIWVLQTQMTDFDEWRTKYLQSMLLLLVSYFYQCIPFWLQCSVYGYERQAWRYPRGNPKLSDERQPLQGQTDKQLPIKHYTANLICVNINLTKKRGEHVLRKGKSYSSYCKTTKTPPKMEFVPNIRC